MTVRTVGKECYEAIEKKSQGNVWGLILAILKIEYFKIFLEFVYSFRIKNEYNVF